MVLELLLVGLTSGLPNISPQRVCRNAGELVLPEDKPRAYDACVVDESAALAKLRAEWPSLPADMRSTCSAGIGGLPSYVDILTCIELRPGGALNRMPDFVSTPHGR